MSTPKCGWVQTQGVCSCLGSNLPLAKWQEKGTPCSCATPPICAHPTNFLFQTKGAGAQWAYVPLSSPLPRLRTLGQGKATFFSQTPGPTRANPDTEACRLGGHLNGTQNQWDSSQGRAQRGWRALFRELIELKAVLEAGHPRKNGIPPNPRELEAMPLLAYIWKQANTPNHQCNRVTQRLATPRRAPEPSP